MALHSVEIKVNLTLTAASTRRQLVLGRDVHIALEALACVALGEIDALRERRTLVVGRGAFVNDCNSVGLLGNPKVTTTGTYALCIVFLAFALDPGTCR